MSDAEPFIRGTTFEEMTVGSRFRTADRTITETDLVNFITLCGFNEPLFWDARHAASAGYKGRLVPGALTYSMAEGLVLQTHVLHGTGLAFMGMQLDVRKPVFVGDTIHAVVEVTECRPASSGGRGVVTTRIGVRNQHDEEVLVYTPVRLIRGRDYVDSATA
jgi:acyl dehydratase